MEGGRRSGATAGGPQPKFSVYQNPTFSAALTAASLRPSSAALFFIITSSLAAAIFLILITSREEGLVKYLTRIYISPGAALFLAKALQGAVCLVFVATLSALTRIWSLRKARYAFNGNVESSSPSKKTKEQQNLLTQRQLGFLGLKPKPSEDGEATKKPPKSGPVSSLWTSDPLVPIRKSVFYYTPTRSSRIEPDQRSTSGGKRVSISPVSSSPTPRSQYLGTPWSRQSSVVSANGIQTEAMLEQFLAEVEVKTMDWEDKVTTPSPAARGFGVASPGSVSTSTSLSGASRSTPLRSVRMSPGSHQRYITPPKKGEGELPPPMLMEEAAEAFGSLGIYPHIEQWRDRLRQWLSSFLLNPLLDKIATSHIQVMQAAASVGVPITVSQVGSDSANTMAPLNVSPFGGSKEWQPTFTLDEDGFLHQLRASLVQARDGSIYTSRLHLVSQQQPQQNSQLPVVQPCLDAITEHQRLKALMKGELVKGLLLQSSIRAEFSVQRVRELAEGTCLKNYDYLGTGDGYEKLDKKWLIESPSDSHLLLYLFCAFLEHPKWMLHVDPTSYSGAQSSKNPLFLGVLPPKDRFPEKYVAVISGAPPVIHPGACILSVGKQCPPVFALYWDKKLQFSLQGRTALWDALLLLCHRIKIGYGGIVRGEGIIPEPDIDAYMKAISMEGLARSLQTDYILRIMGMDICADTMVGDAMRRGISGGQKKRLTTAEIIVGPTKALFMDEISTGLDSSTTFQIISCLQQLAHITETMIVVSLLQPAPETYDLFDDVILMAEGNIVYHGPRSGVLNFFEECGLKCPERKGAADFLQEVLSRKDQEQYWYREDESYRYVSVPQLSKKFKAYHIGERLDEELSKPYDKSKCHKNALSFKAYSLPKMELFKACMARELLLMRRNSFIYIFKMTQLAIMAIITMTVFLRTRMGVDLVHANYYLGSLFFALILLMVNGMPELAMTVSRLPVFYKQRDFYFYPAWAYAVPASILKVPISLIESFLWTSLTYYVIGYSPEAERYFRQFFLLFLVHQMSLSLFRFLASYFQTVVASTLGGTLSLLVILLFGGFIIPRVSMPSWLNWGFWLSPWTYAQIGLTVNEFHAPRWNKISSDNTTIGQQVLASRGLNFEGYFYWISVGALLGYILLFNALFALALTFKRPLGSSRAIISREKLSEIHGGEDIHKIDLQRNSSSACPTSSIDPKRTRNSSSTSPTSLTKPKRTGRIALPFVPLTIAFQDVRYYVDTPPEMKELGYGEKRLQLLNNITGAFRPGILSALMGVSGAGKTTLLDVLSGRKTGGTIEGNIRIGGYPKVQETFARISGYCEQTDIHSPQITVLESVIYSAWLRLPPQIDTKTRYEFVDEVLETIELDAIKDALVGIPGVNGLSTEQRKRLTIAVELVSNPSIIFMDEPTSGLDARAAAIVMRAVKNVAETGRTIVCTIHQPSINIFEAFNELILMKRGGEVIYSGTIGPHSSKVIEYFEDISGVPGIKDNYNPATWMLEVTSNSSEVQLGVDFAHIYRQSVLYRDNEELVKRLSTPPADSADLNFTSRFPQNGWGQFKACLWKQYLSYWRSPSYNLVRILFMIISALTFAVLFWKQGKRLKNQQDLFNVFGSMYVSMIFLGINNSSSVLPFITIERNVLYREKYAGMYSPWAYSFAQVSIEIPYVFLQVVIFMCITYPTIGYYWSAYKLFWFFYTMFCTLLYYVYMGMLLVSLTPNIQVAAILSSCFNTMTNLFSGFIIPRPQIPKWWIWAYYINPMSWTLNGLFTSQYGDLNQTILVFGEKKSISSFLGDYFGFHHDHLGVVYVVLITFPVVFASLFAYFVGKLNFQRR